VTGPRYLIIDITGTDITLETLPRPPLSGPDGRPLPCRVLELAPGGMSFLGDPQAVERLAWRLASQSGDLERLKKAQRRGPAAKTARSRTRAARAHELRAQGQPVWRIAQTMTRERDAEDPRHDRPPINERTVRRWLAQETRTV